MTPAPSAAEDTGYIFDPALQFPRPELMEFLAYWNGKRGGREFPARADIAPRELVRFLPWLAMYDVAPGNIFKGRLVGTGLAGFLPPVDWRGMIVSEQQGELFERLQRALEWVVRERAPLRAYTRNAALPGQGFQGMENCHVPLSSNGADIDIIAVVSLLDLDNVRLKG